MLQPKERESGREYRDEWGQVVSCKGEGAFTRAEEGRGAGTCGSETLKIEGEDVIADYTDRNLGQAHNCLA